MNFDNFKTFKSEKIKKSKSARSLCVRNEASKESSHAKPKKSEAEKQNKTKKERNKAKEAAAKKCMKNELASQRHSWRRALIRASDGRCTHSTRSRFQVLDRVLLRDALRSQARQKGVQNRLVSAALHDIGLRSVLECYPFCADFSLVLVLSICVSV